LFQATFHDSSSSHQLIVAKRVLPRLTNPWMISLLAGYLAQRKMQKKQFMQLFSRLAGRGASPMGKVIPTQSNALATKTRMTKEARETQGKTH